MAEYIDREAALSEFQKVCDVCMALVRQPECGECSVADTVRKVKRIPAADVKPVVHAHFYVDDGCAYCSNCRNNFKKAILMAVKFCPMCGAQIDGYGAHPDAGPPPPYDLLREEGGVGDA